MEGCTLPNKMQHYAFETLLAHNITQGNRKMHQERTVSGPYLERIGDQGLQTKFNPGHIHAYPAVSGRIQPYPVLYPDPYPDPETTQNQSFRASSERIANTRCVTQTYGATYKRYSCQSSKKNRLTNKYAQENRRSVLNTGWVVRHVGMDSVD